MTYDELPPDRKEIVDQVVIDEQGVLTTEQVRRVRELLARFHDCFATNTKRPNATHLIELAIDLVDGPKTEPVKQAPSRPGPAAAAIIKDTRN